MESKWNTRNPAVKRIVQELKEIQRDDNPDILAEALEDNIFEWHFVIRGAWDTEFEGGIYHGRIIMPAEYPFKPPAFVMMSPSGRFETGVKICLSISSFHPESWQPSWSVRSALVALIAFMQTPGNGAVGSLDHTAAIRREIAAEVRTTPPKHSNADRQALINDMHQKMLDLEETSKALHKQTVTVPSAPESSTSEGQQVQQNTAASAEQENESATFKAASEQPTTIEGELLSSPATTTGITTTTEPALPQTDTQAAAAAEALANLPGASSPVSSLSPLQQKQEQQPAEGGPSITPALEEEEEEEEPSPTLPLSIAEASTTSIPHSPPPTPTLAPAPQEPQQPILQYSAPIGQTSQQRHHQQQHHQQEYATPLQYTPQQNIHHHHGHHITSSWEDRGLTYLAVLLVVCIATLLLRKVFVSVRLESDELFSVNPVADVEL